MTDFKEDEILVIEKGSEYVTDKEPFRVHENLRHLYPMIEKKKKVIIGKGIVGIGNDAFRNCQALCEVVLPVGLEEIGKESFNGCTGLVSVTIPDSVTKIGDGAFNGCKGLTSVTIPDSVTEIGTCPFLGCTRLEKKHYRWQ